MSFFFFLQNPHHHIKRQKTSTSLPTDFSSVSGVRGEEGRLLGCPSAAGTFMNAVYQMGPKPSCGELREEMERQPRGAAWQRPPEQAPPNVVPGNGAKKVGESWKRGGSCPFFLDSCDICAMSWRIKWGTCGRLFCLSHGLRSSSSETEAGASWWLQPRPAPLCAAGRLSVSQLPGRRAEGQADRSVRRDIRGLPFDPGTYKHPLRQRNGNRGINHSAGNQRQVLLVFLGFLLHTVIHYEKLKKIVSL